MAQEQQIVELIIDASQANAGALAFEQAANRIQQSSERATASVDKLGQSIDRSGQKMSQAGQRSGAAAMEQHAAATDKATASMRQLAEAHETTIRRMQAGSFNVFDQTATLGALAQYRSQLERGVGPSSLVAVGAPERAGVRATAAAITADSLPLLTEDVFNSIHPSASLSKATRFARQAAAADPSVGADIAKIHSSEAVAVAALPSVAQAAGTIAGAGPTPDQLLSASIERSAAANERAARATEASVAAAADRSALRTVNAPAFVSPANLRTVGAQVERQASIADRAAHGVTTATDVAFASPASLKSLETSLVGTLKKSGDEGGVSLASRITAASTAATRAPTTGLAAPILELDTPLEKARQSTESFWGSLKNLFSGSRSGAGDLNVLAEAMQSGGEAASESGHHVRELGEEHDTLRGRVRRAREEDNLLTAAFGEGVSAAEVFRFSIIELAREHGALALSIALPVGAALAGFVQLIKRADEVDANLRSFNATIGVMGTGSQTSAEELQKLTEELHHTGVSAEDAKKSIDAISRSGFIRPGEATEGFAMLARNIAQYKGAGAEGTAAAAEELVKVFAGGGDSAIKYAESLHVLSGAEIANLHYMDQHAQSGKALETVLKLLIERVPQYTTLLSPAAIEVEKLKTAWDEMVTSLSKTEGIEAARTAITNLLTAMATPVGAETTIGAGTGLAAGVAAGALLGAPTGVGIVPGMIIGGALGAAGGGMGGYLYGEHHAAQDNSGASAPLPELPGAERYSSALDLTVGDLKTLDAILRKAAEGLPEGYSVKAISGYRPGATVAGTDHASLHASGEALDVRIIGPGGAAIPNEGKGPGTPEYDIYQKLAVSAYKAGQQIAPNFPLGWGGNFRSGVPLDLMHFQRGDVGAGGSLAAEAAGSKEGTALYAPSGQAAALDAENQKYKDRNDILAQYPGVAQLAIEKKKQFEEEAAKTVPIGDDQKKFVDLKMLQFWQDLAGEQQNQHRLNETEVADLGKIGAAFQANIAAGYQAQALAQAQRANAAKGGAPSEVAPAAQDILNKQAQTAIESGRERLALAQPAIDSQLRLADAALKGRDAEHEAQIAAEAAAETQDALNRALATGNKEYIAAAAGLDEQARAQIRAKDAAAQGIQAGHQVQANADQSQILSLQIGLQGEGSEAIRTQVELLKTRQEVEERYWALTKDERDAIYANSAGIVLQNAALEQAEQQAQRLNEAFQSIASTIDNELASSIRNALIRTPAEAGEHLKHFWDEFRAGFKATLGDIVSGLSQAAFIKPLTGTIAGALGLGQTAQSLGTFGGLFTGAPAGAAGAGGGGTGLQGLSGSQLALNVSGLTSGSSVFGANVPGSAVFQSGNTITVQGTGAAVAGPGEAATATTGSAGLSADQIQAILDAQPTPLAGSQTTTPLDAALLNISSATGAAQPAASAASTNQTAAGGAETVILNTAGGGVASAASILPQAAAAVAGTAAVAGAETPTAATTPTTPTAAASSGLGSLSNIGSVVGLLDKLNSNLPGFLPSGLGGSGGSGGLFGNFSDVLSSLNPFATAAGPIGGISGAPFSTTVAGPSVPFDLGGSASAVSQGSLFGIPTSATFGSFLGGASAGFGAGSLLNSLIGGNPVGGDIGSAGGAAVGSLIGSIVPGVGTLIGGLIGGLAGGGLGGLVGGPPQGQSAGAVISPTGAIQANTVGGSAANIQQSGSIAQQIGAFVTALNQLTNAQGQKIGTNLATAVVSSNNQSGITVTGTNGVGGQYDQNAAGAVSETELQIVQNLQNVSGTLKTVLANISDPSQLQAAVQFADVYDKLNVTSAQLTASLNGNVDVIGPFQQALTSIQATFSQLTAQAAQFGVDVTPITTALQAVTATLNTDFKTSLDEAFQTAISGGNDFIASLIQVHQAYEQNTSDAAALGLTNLDQQIQSIASLQAGTTLATLGIDQLTTVIQDLGQIAPEVAAQAQSLITSGTALPDVMTQATQAITDPLQLMIEKEQASGDERVAVVQQTGQSLVEAEQLNSASIVQAIVSGAGNENELQGLVYKNNPTALEYMQAAPALAGYSTQQLQAIFADTFNSSPELAALAESFVNTGAALPDTITQSLEGIVNPLELAIQQQTAQAQARTQVGVVAGQNLGTVAALNTASITQAIVQQLGSPEALQALAAHGSAAGLTALQAGPAIAGLGLDQLTALINAIGTAAPNLTAMINALISSGNALPDALTQATEAIVESGVLAVQKAQALAYEQVQAAGPAGQNVSEAQTLGAAEVAQATAQATGTEVPLGPLPDWITQLEEAVAAPLQLAIQKQQAAGIQQVQIAEATGASLVAVQQEQADAIAQIWYQATQQLTSLKNDLTTGSLSGLTAANQVTASIEQFNTVLGLVQGGNTSFINDLASAGQAAVQAAQTAYGNGPQTQSVREQVYQAISPLLVSSSGYPSSDLAAVAAADTTSGTATGTTTDLQNNTTALENLTTAITSATPGSTASLAGTTPAASSAATAATTSTTSTTSSGISGITTNPVTGESFTGTGITAVAPNYPTFPSASTLSGALADAVASQATAADWATINQAVQAGILNAANQPGYALVIQQAQQWAAGQAVNPSAGLAQALSDAVNGTPTLEEWELINQAVNAGILSPLSQPQYASVIRQAQVIADAQATSLSQIPNNQTAYNTTINGLPAFASGSTSTPPGLIMVGEQGPEWYQAANDNRWAQVGTRGPEILDQAGGAQIIPFPMSPPGFAAGTTGFYVPPSAGSESDASNKALIAEVVALRKQVWASQMNADQNAKAQHALTRQTNQYIGPNISAPARRAVG